MSSGLDAIPNIDHCQQLVLSYAILNHIVLHSALQSPPICLIEFDKQIRKDNSTDMQENNTYDKTIDNIKYILD